MRLRRVMRFMFRLTAERCVILALGLIQAAAAGTHPKLFITPTDRARLRHACGVGAPAGQAGRFGAQAAHFNALRSYFADRVVVGATLPGELSAAAFLHVVDPDDPGEGSRLEMINGALRESPGLAADLFELVLALDWCWDALDAEARREFILAVRREAKPLLPPDSPLDHRAFREKLAELALALVVDESDEPGAGWAAVREQLLEHANEYFQSTFPKFVEWRGLAPTSPAAAALEESDAVLAVELAGLLSGASLWTEQRERVGRWLEHYVLADLPHPALRHQFLRERANRAPLTPAARWRDFLPVTAHLLAARTQDPAAAQITRAVEAAMSDATKNPYAVPWRWVPVVFDIAGIASCDPQRLPLARNLQSAVIFRGNAGPETTAVWIEAAQPHLARRQHFDAGHFLIYRGGHLVVEAGDDISFEAVRSKGGVQRLGREKGDFDFDQFFSATIAHNCIVLWDLTRIPRWHGRRYACVGGQRLVEGNCTDFVTPLEDHPRRTARQLAYGVQAPVAYLALDLAPAYEPRAARAYTREFLFVWGRVLVVIDRLKTAGERVKPVAIVNVPARPRVDGRELDADAREAGSDNNAGVWRYDAARWVHWTQRDGALWLTSPLPAARRLAVVGGPATKRRVSQGSRADIQYVGGDTDSFERLVVPSSRIRPRNAWYRLESPTLLGPHFGKSPHWGRVEIEPTSRGTDYVFITVFVTDRADARTPPIVELQRAGPLNTLTIKLDGRRAKLEVSSDSQRGGWIELFGREALRWELPRAVEPDAPFVTR